MWLIELVFSDNHMALLCWALPGKCNWCHFHLRDVYTPHPISSEAGALALSVSVSSGHWHRDDTRRVSIQPGNNRQVRVKGKPAHCSSLPLLESKLPLERVGPSTLWMPASVEMFSSVSSMLALWKHRVTWFHCIVMRTCEDVCYLID